MTDTRVFIGNDMAGISFWAAIFCRGECISNWMLCKRYWSLVLELQINLVTSNLVSLNKMPNLLV